MILGKLPPGKLPPGKLPPGKLPPGKLPPRKIATVGNFSTLRSIINQNKDVITMINPTCTGWWVGVVVGGQTQIQTVSNVKHN